MARDDIQIDVGAKWSGDAALRRASSQVEGLGRGISSGKGTLGQARAGFQNLALGIGVAGAAFYAVSGAAKAAWSVMEQGAQLQTTIQRFDKLSESIGTTADSLLGKLREATRGMISDAQLMASASQIMSLGLADNEQQVTRLATVSGTLGWDMQQVILTFANLSTMRLDALGLSVEGVKAKAKELEEQGLSTAEAFKEAVIQAGEAKLDIGSVSEAEESLKQATAAMEQLKNTTLLATATILEQAGAFDALRDAAVEVSERVTFLSMIDEMRRGGELTRLEWFRVANTLSQVSLEAAKLELQQVQNEARVESLTAAVDVNQAAWESWGLYISMRNQLTAEELQELDGIVGALTMDLAAMAGVADQALFNAQNVWDSRNNMTWGEQRQARRAQNIEYVRHDPEFLESGAETMREMEYEVQRYTGAVRGMTDAEKEAIEARQRFISTFNAELVDPEQYRRDHGTFDEENYKKALDAGLINAEGVVNVEAMNSALYRQVEAAGASAATLALLGIATGQFSEEQAEAALKAAILQEQINKIAESVVSGKITLEQALASLGEAQANINQADLITVAGAAAAIPESERTVAVEADTSGAEAAVTNVQTSLAVLTDEPYLATLDMDIQAVLLGTQEASQALDAVPDIKTVTINWAQAGVDVITALRALGVMP